MEKKSEVRPKPALLLEFLSKSVPFSIEGIQF